MPIEPIGSVDTISPVPATEAIHLDYLNQIHATPEQIALAKAKADELKTLIQRVEDGDPVAITALAVEEKRLAPDDSEQIEGIPPHAPGAYEAGKGGLIDIYE